MTRGENSALREHARKHFQQHMKIDTWEVKDELSDDEHSVSADHRPTDRGANNMISKISNHEKEYGNIGNQFGVPKSGIPKETTSFDASPLVPKAKMRARPTR